MKANALDAVVNGRQGSPRSAKLAQQKEALVNAQKERNAVEVRKIPNENRDMHDLIDTHVHFSGMKRSSVKPRYDLLTRGYLRRITNPVEFGAVKYGEWNWRKAVLQWDHDALIDTLNHLQEHVNSIVKITLDLLNDTCEFLPEDDIAAASFNLMVISEFWDKLGLDAEAFRARYKDAAEKYRAGKAENPRA